jgi:hypothetical protein
MKVRIDRASESANSITVVADLGIEKHADTFRLEAVLAKDAGCSVGESHTSAQNQKLGNKR